MRRRKKTVTTIHETFTHRFPNGVLFKEQHVDGKSNGQFFENKGVHDIPLGWLRFQFQPELAKVVKKMPGSEVIRDEGARSLVPQHIPHDEVESFDDWGNIICFSGYDHMTYRIDREIPVATPLLSDYSGGYTNQEFDLIKLQAHLDEHPWVLKTDRVTIPYYNSDCGDYAVQFVVLPSQRSFNYWYRAMKKKSPGYMQLKECYTSSGTHLPDPLKLQQFRIADKCYD